MYKLFYLFIMMLFSGLVNGQDTSKVKFRPGTLVGKYYGTFDTTSKKPEEIPVTKQITNSRLINENNAKPLQGNALSDKPQLKINQNVNPIEVSGTEQVSKLDVSSSQNLNNLGQQQIRVQNPQIKSNVDINPIEVSGTEQAAQINVSPLENKDNIGQQQLTIQTPLQRKVVNTSGNDDASSAPKQAYRDTRLGSSSPLYRTYETNHDGAGSVTTTPKTGQAPPVQSTEIVNTPAKPSLQYRDTRLGSSSALYNTYEKNDDGAGSVTTTPKSNQGSASQQGVVNNAQQKPSLQYRDTRLGSSSPQYDTYQKNDNGAGSVTTNPNKKGGGQAPVIQPIKPEQTRMDSTSTGKSEVIKPEINSGS